MIVRSVGHISTRDTHKRAAMELHSQTIARVDRGRTGSKPYFLSFLVRIGKNEVHDKNELGVGEEN